MDVFESAPGPALLGVTFARWVQTPTEASKSSSLMAVVGL